MAFNYGKAKTAEHADTGFEPLAPGTYEFQIEGVTIQPYSGSDKIKPCDKLHIQMRIDLANGRTRKVWDDIFLDETHNYSMNKLVMLVESTQIRMPDASTAKQIADKLVSGIGKAEITIREWNGKKSNQVVRYIKPEAPELTEEELPF